MHVPSTQCEAIVHCLLRDSIDSLHFRFHLTCFHLFTSLFWSSRSSADLTKLRFVAKPAASTWNALTYICHLPYAPELWILKSGHTCALLNGLAWCDVSVCRPVLLVISKSTHTDRLNRSASQYNRREQLPWSLPPPSVSLLGLSTTKARTRFKTITRIFQKWFAYEINYFCIYLSIYWRIDVKESRQIKNSKWIPCAKLNRITKSTATLKSTAVCPISPVQQRNSSLITGTVQS